MSLDEIYKEIKDLNERSNNADDLEKLLNQSIKSLYLTLPNGEKNYGGENAQIGKIWVSQYNAHETKIANLEYSPSVNAKKRYNQNTIGKINLRKKTYSLIREYEMSNVLIKDTEKVMKSLGLKKI